MAILSCVWYALVALALARKQRDLSSDGRGENDVHLSLDLTTLDGVSRIFNSDVTGAGVCRAPIDFARVGLTDQGDKTLHFGHLRGAAPVVADGRAINGVANGEGGRPKIDERSRWPSGPSYVNMKHAQRTENTFIALLTLCHEEADLSEEYI